MQTKQPRRSKQIARHQARELLLQAIYQWQLSQTDIMELRLQFLKDKSEQSVDFDYFNSLLDSIIFHTHEYDEIMIPHLDRKFEELDPIALAVLRLSVCELKTREDVPYKVIINEALEIVKSYGAQDSYKFINGVLDGVAKQLGRTIKK